MSDRIEKLQRLLENEPNDPFCLYGLAQEYARIGQHERAIAYFDQTIEVDSSYCYAYYHKARSLEAKGDKQKAVEILEAGLERAQSLGDDKAAEEISEYLHALT